MVAAFNAGLLIRTTGDTIAMSPPLIIERKEVDRIFETLVDIIDVWTESTTGAYPVFRGTRPGAPWGENA